MTGKIVGVLGGMGPAATVRFMARVLALTPAKRDEDHLRMLVDCNPSVPDRNDAARGDGPSPQEVLAAMARGLHGAGAQMLVMPCNAAHAFASAITGATSLPFINLIETVCDEVLVLSPSRVGLLAADGCLEAGLYQTALTDLGIETLVCEPPAQAAFMDLLYQIKAGDTGQRVRAEMAALAARLVERGAQVLIAGCTEVPLVLDAEDVAVPLVDSIDALARKTIAVAGGQK